MGNRIEPATTGRSKCVTCNQPIAKGEARMAEEYSDIGIPKLIMRFYHLRCAAAVHPELVHRALDDVRPGATFDRAELEARLAPAIERETQRRIDKYQAQVAAAKPPVVATDDTTLAALAQLEDNPEDPDTLAIVADQLQLRGDPRGELITVQLALAKAPRRPPPTRKTDDDDDDDDDEVDPVAKLAQRHEQLMTQLALPLDSRDRAIWGVGFIRRLELTAKTATRLAELERIWAHPSLCVVSELRVTFHSASDSSALARLAMLVPRTIRVLELGDVPEQVLTEVPAILGVLPRLRALAIDGRLRTPIAHPGLEKLVFAKAAEPGELLATAAQLSAAALPALRELVLDGRGAATTWRLREDAPPPTPLTAIETPLGTQYASPDAGRRYEQVRLFDDLDAVLARLHASGLLGQLTHLALRNGTMTDAGLATLERGLDRRVLARLDLAATPLPHTARPRLHTLCRELVFTDATPRTDAELWVEHANQPAWGRGKIVRRFDGKLEIEWPKIGKKVFKADAPFLRLG